MEASPIGLSQAVHYAGGPGLPVEVPEFGATERGTAEHWIKEGKGAIKWTRLSCRSFAANAVRLQLHVLAYNRGNFMRSLAVPKAAEPGREKFASTQPIRNSLAPRSGQRAGSSACHIRRAIFCCPSWPEG